MDRVFTSLGFGHKHTARIHAILLFLLVTFPPTLIHALDVEPVVDGHMVNITVVAGQMAMLPCSVENLGRYKVVWLGQNNTILTYGDQKVVEDPRISIVRPYRKNWNLQIRNIRTEDQGQYTCSITTLSPKNKHINLHVKGVGHVGEMMIIKNASRYDADIYEYFADNGVPPAESRQSRVNIEFAPEITMPSTRIGQLVGRDAILECIITAFPHDVHYWEKDGQNINAATGSANSGKYHVQTYDEGDNTITLSLRINDLSRSDNDFGEYKCVASNSVGSDTESMLLFEYSPPKPSVSKPYSLVTSPPTTTLFGNSQNSGYSYIGRTDQTSSNSSNLFTKWSQLLFYLSIQLYLHNVI